jgi:hypothetical protein
MEDEDDADLHNWLEAMDRALAVQEAGHTVVALALGAEVVFVEIDLATGNGGSRSSKFSMTGPGGIEYAGLCYLALPIVRGFSGDFGSRLKAERAELWKLVC